MVCGRDQQMYVRGKARAFYEAWTHASDLVTFAGSLAEAWEIGPRSAAGSRG